MDGVRIEFWKHGADYPEIIWEDAVCVPRVNDLVQLSWINPARERVSEVVWITQKFVVIYCIEKREN
jgi:hypothetical protein